VECRWTSVVIIGAKRYSHIAIASCQVHQSLHDSIGAHGASNPRPFGYESYALTNCAITAQRWSSISILTFVCLVFRGRIPRLSLIQHNLYVGVVENLLPHHSQWSSTEIWSRNTLRVVTARVFYVLKEFE